MADNEHNRRNALVSRDGSLPAAGHWARRATEVSGPLSALVFGIRARANISAMQDAMAHAKVFGQLMEVSAQTIAKIQQAQDTTRAYGVRQELAAELHAGEIERLREQLQVEQHQRQVAAKQRQAELIKNDTEVLLARQTMRAKKKFESLKHAVGEERFKTEAARRKVGAAEAQMAMNEAGVTPASAAAPSPTAPRDDISFAAFVSERLERVRAQLTEMRANGENGEGREQLLADESALARMLADLLKS